MAREESKTPAAKSHDAPHPRESIVRIRTAFAVAAPATTCRVDEERFEPAATTIPVVLQDEQA